MDKRCFSTEEFFSVTGDQWNFKHSNSNYDLYERQDFSAWLNKWLEDSQDADSKLYIKSLIYCNIQTCLWNIEE